MADEQDQDIVHRVDEREHVHGVLCVEQGCCEAHDDHDDGGVHLDSEGGACVFAGVEHAAVEVVDGEGGGAERGDDDELGDDGCCDGVAAAEEYGDGACQYHECDHAEDGGYGCVAQAVGERVDDAVAVVGDGGGAHAVEEHGGDGDADDAVREHVQHGGVVECLQAGDLDAEGGVVFALADDACGDLGHVEECEVGDDAGGEGPGGELGGCAQADASPCEVGLEAQTELA